MVDYALRLRLGVSNPRVPDLRNITMRRGALTRLGAGGVPLAQLMQQSGDAITSWAFASGDTTGLQINATTGAITPTAHGSIGATTRVVGVQATNAAGSGLGFVTLESVPNAYSVSRITELDNTGLGSASIKAGIGGKTVLLSRGMIANFTTTTDTLHFNTWNTHAAGTRFAVTSEFPDSEATWTRTRHIRFTNSRRFDLSCVWPQAYLPPTNTVADQQNPGQVRLLSGCTDVTLDQINCSAPNSDAPLVRQWMSGIEITNGTSISATRIKIARCKDGLRPGQITSCTFDGFEIDTFASNAVFSAGAGNSFNLFRDFIIVRAFRSPIDVDAQGRSDHQDNFQIGGGVPSANYDSNVLENIRMYQADGNATVQGPFADDVGFYNSALTGFGQNNSTMRHIFSDTLKHMGPYLDRGTGWLCEYLTNIRSAGRWIGLANISNGSPAAPSTYQNPQIEWGSTGVTVATVRRCVALDANSPARTNPTMLTENSILLEASKLGPLPAGVNSVLNDAAALEAWYEPAFVNPDTSDLDYPNMTAAQIDAVFRVRYAPKIGGPLDRGDGTFDGMWLPDGSLNAAP